MQEKFRHFAVDIKGKKMIFLWFKFLSVNLLFSHISTISY